MSRFFIITGAGLVILILFSLMLGDLPYSPGQLQDALLQHGDPARRLILWQIRLPRTLLAVMVGAGLGASGAALQGYLRNPLADPGIVGISASAGLGAVMALYFGLTAASIWALPAAAMAGAGLAAAVLMVLARGRTSITSVILGGVALSSLSVALTALLMNLSPNPWALSEIAYWLMGSVADRSFAELAFAAPLILGGIAVLMFSAQALNALGLGEEAARSMGVSLKRTGQLVVFGTLLCVGAGVAVAGAIGFIGLVAPHLVRPLFGARPGALILPSAMTGGVLLLAADILARALSGQGTPLYLGVTTALLGAPFFLYLVIRYRRAFP
ncbi:MAG: ABC transporter permease [Robiginitomaculum sp.]|nr:MAG: ABC transporter permease [Robiginitomaculum sp.]